MRTPALDAWRRELALGLRTPLTFDALWEAACAEAEALDHRDVPTVARSCLRDAHQIIRRAIKEVA